MIRKGKEPGTADSLANFLHMSQYNTGSENYASLVTKVRNAVSMKIMQLIDSQCLYAVAVQIPLMLKIGPYFLSLPYFARKVVEAGSNGLVFFNRSWEPKFHLENRVIDAHLELSRSNVACLSLRRLSFYTNSSFAARWQCQAEFTAELVPSRSTQWRQAL